MKACRAASIVAFGALFAAAVLGACGGLAACGEGARPEVPPVTAARPTATDPPVSGPPADAPTATAASDARGSATAASDAGARPIAPPMEVAIVDLPTRLEAAPCTEAAIAVVRGKASALGETLQAGDAMLVREGQPFDVKGDGVVVTVRGAPREACAEAKLSPSHEIVRLAATPELAWAKGAMRARMQLGEAPRSTFYLGRLEGSAPVVEHDHEGTWEILAALDASGTFVLDGKESRLGPREVVFVPPGTKHAWRPDPGSNLRAVQIYSPRGPEQRFVALAAAAKDAGAPDASAPRPR
ncbi:MAG: cupin domain-containing protein [Labilithrix sp.]|nr:cupin domain-containing protein [Labilithrix sp.]